MLAVVSECAHGMVASEHCEICDPTDPRAQPTAAPPPAKALAEDMRMRGRRLDTMAAQLRREAQDMFFAADRIEELGR